jgi:hypothetical protein
VANRFLPKELTAAAAGHPAWTLRVILNDAGRYGVTAESRWGPHPKQDRRSSLALRVIDGFLIALHVEIVLLARVPRLAVRWWWSVLVVRAG